MPSTFVRLGALFLLASSLMRWFVHPSAAISADTLDGLTGLLSGLTIGFFLVAVYRKAHPTPHGGRGQVK